MTTDDGSSPEVPGSGSGSALNAPLPDLATRIRQAQDAADRRRRELGLPDLPPDEVDMTQPAHRRRRLGDGVSLGTYATIPRCK